MHTHKYEYYCMCTMYFHLHTNHVTLDGLHVHVHLNLRIRSIFTCSNDGCHLPFTTGKELCSSALKAYNMCMSTLCIHTCTWLDLARNLSCLPLQQEKGMEPNTAIWTSFDGSICGNNQISMLKN